MNIIRKYWDKIALAFIMLIAAFLTMYRIWDLGYSNEFYAACVKSMLTSWKNFFFVSLDPGGWVTVDKPPVSLWVQALFAKIFGFHSWSYLLPECLAAVAMVAIIFHIVKRHFGKVAGLISALVLALSPIFIIVSKTNNTDTILILFMVLSTWAMMVAADKGQLRYLILSVVLLGIAYNAKTLEAFFILPALYAVYFFAANLKWKTRICNLLVATLVLAVVSLSWSVIVDLTPASERPYVDNSTTNSEMELAIDYNGIQRITGQSSTNRFGGGNQKNIFNRYAREFGGFSRNRNTGTQSSTTSSENKTGMANSGADYGNRANGRNGFGGSMPTGMTQGNRGGGNGGGGFDGGGDAGILRMFNSTLGGQDSWLLPFGFFAILALLLRMRKSAGEDKQTRKILLRNVLMWGISVVAMFAYFDIAGFFHQYYISAMAPFLAALVGIGLVQMWKLYKAEGIFGFLLPLALAVTLAVQIVMLSYFPTYSTVLIPIVFVVSGIPTIALVVLKLMHKNTTGKIGLACVTLCFAGLLITPAVWTTYSAISLNFSASIPSAGPSSESGGMFGRNNSAVTWGNQQPGGNFNMGEMPNNQNNDSGAGRNMQRSGSFGGFGNSESSSDTKLINYLVKNNTGEKWLIAVSSSSEAEPLILATGKPVIAIGGFSGNDKTLTVAKLKELVKSGQLKYYLVGGRSGPMGGSSDSLTTWVEANGKSVSQSKWSNSSSTGSNSGFGNSGFGNSETLYDLSSYKVSGK